jgi:zinc protease
MVMKKVLSIFVISALYFLSWAQNDALNVQEYSLSNGLKVYLNEDHSMPSVLGLVVVKGGSKVDPPNSTGIAHYLEHMMFKGTDEMGTVDYQAEKVYLDSIQMKYDELAQTEDEDKREAIQKDINRISLKAAEFAIPNEFDKLMSLIGGENVNAFTNYDQIAYYNSFPSNEMERWLEIYSHRFENPVFRLFQSELETVYEEKNMSMDNFGTHIIELYSENFYKKHPYGQQTVLGDVKHLKNPALSDMYKYFETYYVANNMALILTGDFEIEKVKPIIEQKFGKWKSSKLPEGPEYTEEDFDGREIIKKRLSPIPLGVIGWRTVPEGHPDQLALEICSELLSNYTGTGYLDMLYVDNKLMFSTVMPFNYNDAGAFVAIMLPKLFRQSLKKAEKLVLAEIQKVKDGDFDEAYLDAIKTNLKKDFYNSLEDSRSRGFYIMNAFLENKPWEKMLAYPDEVDDITKEKVVEIANKYFTEDRLVMYSKMGFPKKEKLEKPPFESVSPKNAEAKSKYFQKIENMETKPATPRFIDFGEDVLLEEIDEHPFYYTTNPINQIFTVKIMFGVGTHKIPYLSYATQYVDLLGTEDATYDEIRKELQMLGGDISIWASNNYLTINISGLDENLQQTLEIANRLINNLKADDEQLEKFIRESKSMFRFEKKDPGTVGDALFDYAKYNEKSDYINRPTLKELKKIKSDTLLSSFREALNYDYEIHYVGTIDVKEAAEIIRDKIHLESKTKPSESPVFIELEKYDKNTVYFVNDKKAIQSQIYMFIPGMPADEHQVAVSNAFDEYFGSGMTSVMFQELREFRSLAYTAYGYYYVPFYEDKSGHFTAYLSTQSDKTLDALMALNDLLNNFPVKEERLKLLKSSLIQSVNTNRPSFRQMSNTVSYWKRKGYKNDPRKEWVKIYNNLTFEDITKFYDMFLKEKPRVITIVGDKRRIDFDKLSEFGEVIELDKKDLFTK